MILSKNKKNKRTMSPCLVQQLFRQTIGVELDQGIVDEVLFPMLRLRKDLPRELLQDIKLTSDILVRCQSGLGASLDDQQWRENVPTFTPIPEDWGGNSRLSVAGRSNYLRPPPEGSRSSKLLRKKIRRYDWGAIDILNQLRELEYAQMGYKPGYYEEKGDFPGDEFDYAYIRLEEDKSLPPSSWSVAQQCHNRVAIEDRTRFVNNFLKDVIVTGKLLTWEGDVLEWEPCELPRHPPFQFLCRQDQD